MRALLFFTLITLSTQALATVDLRAQVNGRSVKIMEGKKGLEFTVKKKTILLKNETCFDGARRLFLKRLDKAASQSLQLKTLEAIPVTYQGRSLSVSTHSALGRILTDLHAEVKLLQRERELACKK